MFYYPLSSLLIECLILSIVEREDSYGYEISQTVKLVANIKESTLYPILRKLEQNGYLHTYSQEFQGRNRKYYSITDSGKEQLIKRYKKEQDIHLTKEEYLAQLKKYLKRLPKEDYNNAMDYFTEYFEDAGPEGEAALIQELGTPKEAAYEILDNLITEKRKDPDTPIWKIIFLTFLSICAAPIGGALALTIIALALAGVLVIVAGLLAIFSFGIAFALVGGKLFIRGIIAITASLSGASLISGAGLFSIGISILAILAVFCFCKWIVLVLAHFIQNMSRKRSVK